MTDPTNPNLSALPQQASTVAPKHQTGEAGAAANLPTSAPSGSDLGEGEPLREALRACRRRTHGPRVGWADDITKIVDDALIADRDRTAALSTPSSTLTPDADVEALALRLELVGQRDEDETYPLYSGYELTGGDLIRAAKLLRATPAIRDQAFEEASLIRQTMNFFRSVIKSGEPWTDACEASFNEAIRALKGTPPFPVDAREMCPSCGGAGEIGPDQICSLCSGSGGASPSPDLLKELVEALEALHESYVKVCPYANLVAQQARAALLKVQQQEDGQ